MTIPLEQRRGHAVVLGASMAGMLAARVLADFYDRVTVVERDILPTDPVNRKGVPQGRLIHACLARLTAVLDELFPGFSDELLAAGVTSWSDGDFSKLHWSFAGHPMVRSGTSADAPVILSPSRARLDHHVRQRVQSIPNVSVWQGYDVVGLMATPERDRIIGARVMDRAKQCEATLDADLVIDATGRGSRTPVFLDQLGYGRPAQDELTVQPAYGCELLKFESGAVPEHFIAMFPEPGQPRMFALIEYENDTWMVGTGTMAGAEPPRDHAEILRFADEVAPAHVAQALRRSQAISSVMHHRVPSNRWRRFDKMRRLPDGLLVVGDALCSFNPIYGQGMTIAAIEATVLRDCLLRGGAVGHLTRRFNRMAAKQVRVAWQTAVGSDLSLPEVPGPRPLSMRISNACLEPVMVATETDPVVAAQFMRVTAMIDPPTRLLRPSILLRVLRAQHRRASTAAESQPSSADLITGTPIAM